MKIDWAKAGKLFGYLVAVLFAIFILTALVAGILGFWHLMFGWP